MIINMKIFTLIIAILAIFPWFLNSPQLGVFVVNEPNKNDVMWNMGEGSKQGEMGDCTRSQCVENAFGQSSADTCVKHCIQNIIAQTTFFDAFIQTFVYDASFTIAFLAFVFLSLFLSSYAIVRYLLYAYTLFHLRFVKTIVLRD